MNVSVFINGLMAVWLAGILGIIIHASIDSKDVEKVKAICTKACVEQYDLNDFEFERTNTEITCICLKSNKIVIPRVD